VIQPELTTVSVFEIPRREDIPEGTIVDARYEARFARTSEEVDAALRLRFEVFNLELGEGLSESFETGRDEDRFDASCHHLIVVERASGDVVGTYRLQTSAMAATGYGFYSASEFDLSRLPASVIADAVELGRACIARPHRNTRVLFLLWRGIAAYVAHNRKRFLFGCCSITSQNPNEGLAVLALLELGGLVDGEYVVPTREPHVCVSTDGAEVAASDISLPPLFNMYMRFGARVCSAPAIDRAFGTIDFLVLFDADRMPRRTHQLFF